MARRSRRRSGGSREAASAAQRNIDYTQLVNPLVRQPAVSEDRVAAIHDTALRVVEELGIRVLNETARERFARVGAEVDPDSWMVKIERNKRFYK